jgi:hypothetical protein
MDKAHVGNFGRDLGFEYCNCWTHSASAVLQMFAGLEGYILWDKYDLGYSYLKSDSVIDRYGV